MIPKVSRADDYSFTEYHLITSSSAFLSSEMTPPKGLQLDSRLKFLLQRVPMFGTAAPKYQDHTQHPQACLFAMESEALESMRAKSLHDPSI